MSVSVLASRLLEAARDERLPVGVRREAERDLAVLDGLLEADPLLGFEPHSEAQRRFLEARTPVQAAFAGNQFGKTCALVVKGLVQHYPDPPEHLARFKCVSHSEPVFGYLLAPSFKVFETVTFPELRKWAPRPLLLGGSFDRAWDKQGRCLRFADGGALHVFTYEQDADKLVGARLDYVLFDEPPPEAVRREAMMRLVARGGFEAFAMTPVNMAGGGIGWIYREIWKRREHPDFTVVSGSIHDNPLLDRESVARTLARYPDEERRAREFGEFLHVGGMVYSGGFEGVLCDPPSREVVAGWDVVVGLDPGLRNAAFVWVGFDSDGVAWVFDEVLVRDGTPGDYVEAIGGVNARWGVVDPLYVIDPSARNRSLVNAESVEGELRRLGVVCFHGQNDVQAGVQQVRLRLQRGMLFVSRECRGLRDEAEEYRVEDRQDGEFRVVKENDHRLDALRYAVMHRPFVPSAGVVREGPLGWVPGRAPDVRGWRRSAGSGYPLGSLA